jgi:hypothetical protein
VLHPETNRVIAAAPLLAFLIGQSRSQCRRYFQRMGWHATIVR